MRSKFILAAITIAAILALGLGTGNPSAGRDTSVSAQETEMATGGEASSAGDAVSRTPEEMQAAQAAISAAPIPAPTPEELASIAPKPADPAKLAAGKAAADAAANEPNPGGDAAQAPAPAAPPTLRGRNFEGNDINDNVFLAQPPDPHGAVGNTQVMQVTNSWITVRTKGSNTAGCLNVSLNAFFGKPLGSFANIIFDPRAEFDDTWDRWIVVATEFPDSSSVGDPAEFWIAVSKTANPCGAYWIWQPAIAGGPFTDNAGELVDYPMVGYDANNVFVTWNHFDNGGYDTTAAVAVPKALLYNGFGWAVGVPFGFAFTLAPPVTYVADTSPRAYFLAADSFGGPCGAGVDFAQYSYDGISGWLFNGCVNTENWGFPASIAQPGVNDRLDSLDGRIQNRITQVSGSLYAIHTSGNFAATPYFYRITASTRAVVAGGHFFEDGFSDEWNPSIAANAAGDVFISFSSASAGGGAPNRAKVMVIGCQVGVDCPATGAGLLPTSWPNVAQGGTTLLTSPAVFDDGNATVEVFRWGDYSQTHLDPQAYSACAVNRRAWGFNERSNAGDNWSTQIYRFGFC